MNTQRLQWHFS